MVDPEGEPKALKGTLGPEPTEPGQLARPAASWAGPGGIQLAIPKKTLVGPSGPL